MKDLSSTGLEIVYKQVDVTDKQSVKDLVENIKSEFGGLTGIIHAAGVLRDSYIVNKTKEELHNVLAPKVSGLVNLDLAAKEEHLDFFVVFSSLAAVFGSVGQADYALANSFMDVYAKYRNGLVSSKKRFGRTLSINWPLWKDGGMHVDEWSEKRMTESTGMVTLRTDSGIYALKCALHLSCEHMVVLEGDVSRINEFLSLMHLKGSKEIKCSEFAARMVAK